MANNIDVYRLTELHRSGYEVAAGDADVRGWKVINGDAQTIGEVVELLFYPLSQAVRYLVVNIDGKPINLLSRDVLIPVGLADIIEENGIVVVPSVNLGQLAALPAYKKSDLNPAFERAVRQVFTGNATEAGNAIADPGLTGHRNFYDHDHFNRERLKSDKAKNQGTSNTISSGSIQREQLIPKENNLNSPQHFGAFKEGTIEITEHKEIPVITKEARVVEEVKVTKDVFANDVTVRDSVRRTEVDIDRLPPKD